VTEVGEADDHDTQKVPGESELQIKSWLNKIG
jgi:hypothetical protein